MSSTTTIFYRLQLEIIRMSLIILVSPREDSIMVQFSRVRAPEIYSTPALFSAMDSITLSRYGRVDAVKM